jgi:hypothetical protein
LTLKEARFSRPSTKKAAQFCGSTNGLATVMTKAKTMMRYGNTSKWRERFR